MDISIRLKISLLFFCLALVGIPFSEVKAYPNLLPSPKVEKDSIPKIKYSGYRLYLTHFERIKEKKDFLYIKLSAINTGNKSMDLGKGSSQIFPVVKFDESIVSADLNDFQKAIYFKLLDKKVSVPIGAISTNIELKLPLADRERPSGVEENETPVTTTIGSKIEEATIISEKAPKKEKKKKNKKEQAEEVILAEAAPISEATSEVEQKENTNAEISSTPVKEKKKKAKKAKKQKINPVAENTSEIEPDNSEDFSEMTTSMDPILSKEKGEETTIEEVTLAPIVEKENTEAIAENTPETVIEEAVDTDPVDLAPPTIKEIIAKSAAEGCSDLVLKNLTILKKNKKSVTLQYELFNQGVGTAHLVLGTKSKQESLAIRANLSSSERLTRGSIPIESIFLHGDEVSIDGGESYTGEVKLSLLKFSKFTPVLILEVDAYEFVPECDETNNKSFVRLLEKEEN